MRRIAGCSEGSKRDMGPGWVLNSNGVVGVMDVGVVLMIVVFILRASSSTGCTRARLVADTVGRRFNDLVDCMRGSKAVAERQQIRIRKTISDPSERNVEMFENPTLAARNIELPTYIGEVKEDDRGDSD